MTPMRWVFAWLLLASISDHVHGCCTRIRLERIEMRLGGKPSLLWPETWIRDWMKP